MLAANGKKLICFYAMGNYKKAFKGNEFHICI